MVTSEDVINIYKRFTDQGIRIWLTGGWGIDALLGKQTRQHKDLDVLMLVDDVAPMQERLAREGYQLKELWSENLWTVDTKGGKTDTAFVLRDPEGRELDVHAMRLDDQGNALPAWNVDAGFFFKPHDLAGMGTIDGYPVSCQSAENQIACHTGYLLPDYQWNDLAQLAAKFGLEIPAEITNQRSEEKARQVECD